jgi:MFS family permease
MALPFYVVQATVSGVGAAEVAMLLGAQTTGALVSNPLWGWWGDRIGKRPLLEGVAALSVLAPGLALAWPAAEAAAPALIWFGVVFFMLGVVGNGSTIAQLGYLMEISPDDRRPAYSGYFNAIVAPAALSPLAGAAFVEGVGLLAVFLASAVAAFFQFVAVRRLRRLKLKEAGI